MSAVALNVTGELVDGSEFFAPVSSDLIDGLIGQYQSERRKIETVAEFMATEVGSVLNYFIDGNQDKSSHVYWRAGLFEPAGAIAELNAAFWQRALNMTDVLDCMPQKRRDEWFEQIRNPLGTKRDRHSNEYTLPPLPDFDEEVVRATIGDLLAMRSKFFAERVDGMFRALSGTHVTNEPQGFGKRMIIAHVIQSFGTVNHSKAGFINDLRAVIAKFMGRDAPHYSASDHVINAARRNPGQWMSIDGGALRIRVYAGVGTAHLEVHPDMAWRLNCILASLYPAAIPPKFRQKPAKKQKEFVMMGRPLPFAVVSTLAGLKEVFEFVENGHFRERRNLKNTRASYADDGDKYVSAEVERVLTMIGGVKVNPKGTYTYFQFDYDPQSVIDEIVCSGCIPDQKSHQFYPTPESLAKIAVELAEICPGHLCLEPSAGTGGLADFMPKDRTTCIEISGLHCKVLEAKGYRWVQDDFLNMQLMERYDRVVMNPPFSSGRWQAHLQHAAKMLAPHGRLVAILPASAKDKDDLLPSNFACEWSQVYSNEFANTSVSVVMLAANKLQ